jgi:putative peptidoglycan lipid II flippase
VGLGLTTYQKANLIYILPHSIITISLITALLPKLSSSANQNNEKDFGHLAAYSFRMILTLMIPVALFLFITAPDISVFLFGYGAAGIDAARIVGVVTALFALGLPAFSLIYVINRIWYSLEDTRTPFLFSIVINVIAVALGIYLFSQATGADKIGMFGISYAIAYWVCLGLSLWVLQRKVQHLELKLVAILSLKVLLAAGITSAILWWLMNLNEDLFTQNSIVLLLKISVVWILGIVLFILFASLLRIREIRDAASLLAKRLKLTSGN